MPIFSLPDGCAVGDLGAGARRFIEFLKSAGQSIWQVLPLGPTAKGNSPYSSKSAFAGNPLLISCEDLVSSGLLTGPQLVDAGYFTLNQGHVQYDVAQQIRMPLLKLAFLKFCADGSRELRTAFAEFQEQNQSWLPEFARYDVLAEHLGDPDWSHWPPDLVQRQPSALQHADRTFADQIQLTKFIQFLFADQWQKLKQLANADGIRMYGDMPIFVAYESVDVWCHQDLFHLDGQGQPHRCCRSSAGLLQRNRTDVGQPVVSVGCPGGIPFRMVGRTFPRRLSGLRHSAN
ncbi:MAG: 4-alpha-glucanotransferase [Planctomycetaceae bacterium]